MTPTELISVIEMIAIPMWILMVLLPEWNLTQYLINKKVAPKAIIILIITFLLLSLQTSEVFCLGHLASPIELLTTSNLITTIMASTYVLKLFIGMWILNMNQESKLPYLIMVACMMSTYYIAPLGLAMFFLFKWIKKNQSYRLYN